MLLLERGQLVDGVEDGLLDAGARIQLRERNHGIDVFRHPVSALVAVGDGVADGEPFRAYEDEIYTPRVYAYGLRDHAGVSRRTAAREHVAGERLDVPAVVSVPHDLRVVEAVDFPEPYLSVLDPAGYVPPRRGPYVYGEMHLHDTLLIHGMFFSALEKDVLLVLLDLRKPALVAGKPAAAAELRPDLLDGVVLVLLLED